MGFEKRTTLILLFTGLITFSLAHIIFAFFFLLSEFKSNFIIIGISGILLLVVASYFQDQINVYVLDRIASSGSTVAGDNRSELMLRAIENIDSIESFSIGKDKLLALDKGRVMKYLEEWEKTLSGL